MCFFAGVVLVYSWPEGIKWRHSLRASLSVCLYCEIRLIVCGFPTLNAGCIKGASRNSIFTSRQGAASFEKRSLLGVNEHRRKRCNAVLAEIVHFERCPQGYLKDGVWVSCCSSCSLSMAASFPARLGSTLSSTVFICDLMPALAVLPMPLSASMAC